MKRAVKKKFTFVKLLGQGSFARVHLVNKNLAKGVIKDRFELYAMKSISKRKIESSMRGIQALVDEIMIHH